MSEKMVSLASLNAVAASDHPFEFEYIDAGGNSTGIFFSVIGGQSDKVTQVVSKMVNERRRKDAARAVAAKLNGKRQTLEFETLETDVEFGQRLAAIRLVGWRGITDPYTPENALALCQSNRLIAAAIVEASDEMANFMKL